jgi:hypothetical protein
MPRKLNMFEGANLTNIGFETLEMCSTSIWGNPICMWLVFLFSESSFDYYIEAWPRGCSRHEHSWMSGFDAWPFVPKTCCIPWQDTCGPNDFKTTAWLHRKHCMCQPCEICPQFWPMQPLPWQPWMAHLALIKQNKP